MGRYSYKLNAPPVSSKKQGALLSLVQDVRRWGDAVSIMKKVRGEFYAEATHHPGVFAPVTLNKTIRFLESYRKLFLSRKKSVNHSNHFWAISAPQPQGIEVIYVAQYMFYDTII